MTITLHIFRADQRVDTIEWAAQLTAGEAKRELQDLDKAWIGVLRAEGSTALLAPQQVLADGATYELLLQRQSGGQCYSRQNYVDSLPATQVSIGIFGGRLCTEPVSK